MTKPRIAWLLTDWAANPYRQAHDLYGGIGYYRVVLPSRSLRKWFDIEVIGADFQHWGTEDETYTRLGRDYDLIYSKHIMSGRTASNVLATADHYKRKVLVDIDDNYFALRADNSALKDYDVGKDGRYFIGAMLKLASGVTVSTEPLKAVYKKLNKHIDVLPNCNDIREWPKAKKWDDGKIRIGYAGGTAHNDDLDLIVEPMAKILTKYQNVYFEVVGALSPQKAREMGGKMLAFGPHTILDRFRITGGTEAWLGYPQHLAAQGWDITLAPLVDEPFNRGKSHIRWLESAMIGCPVIASPVYPYKQPILGTKVIEHGMTGLFASTSQEWTECLELLIRNPDIRRKMAKNAYSYIKEHWQQKQWAEQWRDVINKYL